MAGTVRTKRDLGRLQPFQSLYASALTGGVVNSPITLFTPSQDTTSYRSGGAYGETIDNPRELLSRNETKNRFPYDRGNEFQTLKTKIELSHKRFTIRSPYHNAWYQGPLIPVTDLVMPSLSQANGLRFSLPLPSFDITKGTKALRVTRPTKSAANLSQALLELIVDLPRYPFRSLHESPPINWRSLGRNGGSEYLNVVFGWQPLVSDVLKICKAIVNSGDIIEQYVRDAGRNVRRSLDFPLEETRSSSILTDKEWLSPRAYNGNDPHSDLMRNASGSMIGDTSGTVSYERVTATSYRFSGAWTYFLDSDSSPIQAIRRYARLADRVLGIGIDAETLWEVAPWSWLADWFVNIGDVISVNNALANDSLLLRYGYLTRKTSVTDTWTSQGEQFPTVHTGPFYVRASTSETRRVRATPYGFGLNTDSFSVNQWAILVALGMTGGDKKLRWG